MRTDWVPTTHNNIRLYSIMHFNFFRFTFIPYGDWHFVSVTKLICRNYSFVDYCFRVHKSFHRVQFATQCPMTHRVTTQSLFEYTHRRTHVCRSRPHWFHDGVCERRTCVCVCGAPPYNINRKIEIKNEKKKNEGKKRKYYLSHSCHAIIQQWPISVSPICSVVLVQSEYARD